MHAEENVSIGAHCNSPRLLDEQRWGLQNFQMVCLLVGRAFQFLRRSIEADAFALGKDHERKLTGLVGFVAYGVVFNTKSVSIANKDKLFCSII